jgi:aspartate ammonia-lyase
MPPKPNDMTAKRTEFRLEKDSLGQMNVPSQSYWGIKTARAQEQLFLCGIKTHPMLIESIVLVKKALAGVNQDLGRLEPSVSRAIMQACDEILSGKLREHIVTEPFQSGASYVFDANVSEVLANRAEELMGGELGEYNLCKPELVNYGQTASEVIGTAMRLAVFLSLKEFEPAVLDLERLLRRKALELAKSAKLAKAPGGEPNAALSKQEFNAFGSAIERGLKRIKDASLVLCDLPGGSSNLGTAGGADADYGSRLVEKLSKSTGLKLRAGEETGRSTQSLSDFLHVSSCLKELAVELSKIADGLRKPGPGSHQYNYEASLPSEGELAGHRADPLNEPGLVGFAEGLCVATFQVIGNDLAAALASQSAQAQRYVAAPVVMNNLLQSIDLLRQAISCFNQRFLASITADNDRIKSGADLGSHFFALLSEHIGMEKSRQLYEEFAGSSKEISEALGQRNMVPPEVLEKLSRHSHPEHGHATGMSADEVHSGQGEKKGDTDKPQGT